MNYFSGAQNASGSVRSCVRSAGRMSLFALTLAVCLVNAGTTWAVDIKSNVLQTPVPVTKGGTGATTATGAVTNLLPSQTGNAGYVLGTNGSATSWVAPATGGGGATLPFPGIVYSTSATGGTVATSSQIQTAIGSGIYDASGAAVAVQSAVSGGSVPVPATALTGTIPISSGGTGASTAQAALQALEGQPSFYATNYGAKFNGVYKADFTTTASSTTVSSASYNFTSADVNKAISLYAGSSVAITGTVTSGSLNITAASSTTGVAIYQSIIGAGIPAGTYVDGVIPGTNTIIMSKPASTTATAESITLVNVLNTTITGTSGNAAVIGTAAVTSISGVARGTFGTDDTTSNQNAINAACTAGSGVVQWPAGTAMITAPLIPCSNVSYNGLGFGVSILKWSSATSMSSSNAAMFFGTTATAAAPYQNIAMSNFQIDMDSATESPLTYFASCLSISYTQNFVMTGMYLHGSPASCFRNDYAQNMIITSNIFAHTGRLSNGSGTGGNSVGATLAESPAFPTSSIVSNNIFFDPGVTAILYQTNSATNSKTDTLVATGNLIYYNAFSTNATNIAGIDEEGTYGAVISGNVLVAPSSATTSIYGIGGGTGDNSTSPGASPSINGVIENNTIAGFGVGVFIDNPGTSNYRVINNSVIGAGAGGCYRVYSSSSTTPDNNLEFSGNVGYNCGGPGLLLNPTASSGIAITNLTLKNNKFYDNGSAGGGYKQAGVAVTGVSGYPINGLVMENNEFFDDGAATQSYAIAVNTNTSITNAFINGNNFNGNTVKAYDMIGTISGFSVNNQDGTPTVANGAAAGTSPGTPTITGNNQRGTVSVTTGTAPTSGILETVTFGGGLAIAPNGCSLTPQNAAAAQAAALFYATAPSTTAWTISIVGSGLTASTAYSWSYACQ